MKYWWVNHGQTYKYEVPGDFLWSPLVAKDGRRNPHYDNMKKIAPGDLVFSYSKKLVRAIGVAKSFAEKTPKPDFRKAGSNWADIGWWVEVEFSELKNPISPTNYKDEFESFYGKPMLPFENTGRVKTAYLFEIPEELFKIILEKTQISNIDSNTLIDLQLELDADNSEKEILQRKNIGPLEKTNLVKSRRGQGIFKTNVKIYESKCRVTGLTDRSHLTASHIKPWSMSSDDEKIDGNNGLLLSPHIDRLFNYGYISFTNEGELLLSKKLNKDVFITWKISTPMNVGTFRKEQFSFLEYHRKHIFKI